jgi:hypothetical protein
VLLFQREHIGFGVDHCLYEGESSCLLQLLQQVFAIDGRLDDEGSEGLCFIEDAIPKSNQAILGLDYSLYSVVIVLILIVQHIGGKQRHSQLTTSAFL